MSVTIRQGDKLNNLVAISLLVIYYTSRKTRRIITEPKRIESEESY